jgi:hypothetical protein
MENRRSWEFAAIPIVVVLLGIVAVILWAADAGLAVWLVVGAVILVALLVVGYLATARPHHPPAPAEPIAPGPHPDDGVHRILLIADDTYSPGELGRAVAGHAGGASVHVIAPALGSRTARLTGDDHAYQDAERHLRETLAALAELKVEADGRVGPHDPLQAADDGLREFPADEIVFAVHPDEAANWLEQGVVEQARSRYTVTVTELVLQSA